MSKKKKKVIRETGKSFDPIRAFFVNSNDFDNLCVAGYTSLDKNPEIMAGCLKIAYLVGSMTIHLMSNTDKGDIRIINELSRKIDIDPMPNMTRINWMAAIMMNLLLYGNGNSVVLPHTYQGQIKKLEPINASRITFIQDPTSYSKYKIAIDGKPRDPEDLLHFVYNPDKNYLWKGQGITVQLKDVADKLKQASHTEKAFMSSKFKPSIIVKVDALTDEFSGKSGREKLLKEYVESSNQGDPWLIPANQFQVEQVKPLSLADLAINDTVKLDKQTVASIIGVPAFVLGVGAFDKDEWNNFIQEKIRTLALIFEQESTKKLIINPKWYLKLNMLSLYNYSISDLVELAQLTTMGILTKNEMRDRLSYERVDGLDEFTMLENYIPVDKAGDQKKLN